MTERNTAFTKKVILLLSFAMCAFHCYTAFTTPLQPMEQRGIHLAFALALVFLYAALNEKNLILRMIDYVLAIVGIVVNFYVITEWQGLAARTTRLLQIDFIMAALTIFLVLYATWKSVGIWMPLIALVFIGYAWAGPYLPGVLHFSGISLTRFLSAIYIGTEGIFGNCLGVSATFAFMFLLYAEFLVVFGAGDFVIQISQACMGSVRGGPAKIAVVASSLFGAVSGSAVANVAGTGCITIPLMKKAGYTPEFAGAVEASASTGGQIMPPMMGTAAFVMAEMLNMAYAAICVAALIPSVLYYVGLFIVMDLKSVKLGILGLPKESLPNPREVLKDGWHYMISIVVLLVLLLGLQWSPTKAALWAAVALVIADWGRKLLTKQAIDIKIMIQIFEKGAKSALTLATVTACAGIIIGAFVATGLNLRFSTMLIELSGGYLPLLLILSAIGALILGMGLPTTPVYILLSVLVVPALTKMGVEPLAAHMFIFYFGVMAPITPPVGLAFYVAAGIAESKPIQTGLNSFLLSISGFLLPFVFVYDSGLLLQGTPLQIIWAIIYATIGTAALCAGVAGYLFGDLNVLKRGIVIIAAILTIVPEMISSIIGIAIIAAFVAFQWMQRKNGVKAQAA